MLRPDRTGLSGTIPESLGSLAVLSALSLYFTRLSGTMPPGLCAATIDVHGCALARNGSAGLAACTKLTALDLSNNSLTSLPGSLPPGLSHLYLGSNPLRTTTAELSAATGRLPRLAALDVAFLGLGVDLRATRVTAPTGCRLGRAPPACVFELQLVDEQRQPVKVGGLKPGLALGPRGQPGGPRRAMTDMGDGRYTVAVDASWAPNRTADSLLVSFFDGDAEFSPWHDGGGAYVSDRSQLHTVRYGPAECSAAAHTRPDP